MNSDTATYQFSPFTGVRGSLGSAGLVRDGLNPDQMVSHNLEARVRSGDYFINLATTLDGLNQDIKDYPTRAQIEDVVSDLIYLYDHFTISKKES